MLSVRSRVRSTFRENRSFHIHLDEIHKSQWYSIDELAEFRDQQLDALLKEAIDSVPFYQELLKNTSNGTEAAQQLENFPYIDKQLARAEFKNFLSFKAKKPLITSKSSGTTGMPLTLLRDLESISRENAFIRRQMEWAGYEAGDRIAWIRGDMIIPSSQSHPPFWRRNRAENSLMCSSYHLSEQNASAYLDTLAKFDPAIIMAYPSSIGFLASYLSSRNQQFAGRSLKGIITSSEAVSDECRQHVIEHMGCRIFDWYGQAERVAAIGTCEHGRYHVISDYGHTEFIKDDEGNTELVGTGYINHSMPLIRYRTGDYIKLAHGETCPCGRSFPLVSQIRGRCDDYIKLPDGRHIGRIGLIFNGIKGMLEAQVVQNSLNRITINVVPAHDFSDQTCDTLFKNARERVGNDTEIDIQSVQQLNRTGNGKLRNVICNV